MFGPLAPRRAAVRAAATARDYWTVADLDLLPDDEWFQYEIIDGVLHVTERGHWTHQSVCGNVAYALDGWAESRQSGYPVIQVAVILGPADFVVPDVIWITPARLRAVLDADGHLRGAPEFIAEVLSPESAEADWDRETKLALYERVGVQEYWIVDWERQRVRIYRREGDRLWLVGTLFAEDTLTSPLLPGFACPVQRLFG